MLRKSVFVLALGLGLLSGCATNPVTGERQLKLVSEQQELAIGAQQYAPARQSQGGDYVVDKELTTYVSEVGQRLAAVSDRKLPYEFKVLNNSVPNAWALPGGKISINRGLLTELHSEAELAAVLGHEIVHAAAGHGASQMSKGMLLQTAMVGVAVAAQGSEYANLAQMGGGIGAQLLTQKFGRDAERESDYYGMQYMVRAGYDPQGAVNLQRTFVKMSEGKRQDWISGLFASHPASQERVNNNLALLATLPKGGEMGVERYRAKTSHLLKAKPAYADYDKGRQALAKGEVLQARRLANKALQSEPNEALFYSLLGDADQKQGKLRLATREYDQAIRLNPDFFYSYMQRGLVYERLNHVSQAQADLKKSIKMLPTVHAYHSLGNMARKAGRFDEAKGFYARVANNQTDIGKQAYGALVDLDLPTNPSKYLQVRAGQDARGRILAQLNNPTPRNVGGLVLSLRVRGVDGQVLQAKHNVQGSLPAGQQQLVDLGLTGRLTAEQLQTLQVGIIAAKVMP